MEERGPDVQLLLFAFAIFCMVTGVRPSAICVQYSAPLIPTSISFGVYFQLLVFGSGASTLKDYFQCIIFTSALYWTASSYCYI